MTPDASTQWYEEQVRRYGYGYRALGFGQRASQVKRFEAAERLGAFHGRSVLDAGCGFGDLLAWLNARGVYPHYTGLDNCRPMTARGETEFGERARFITADALTFVPDEQYDYVVASGLFGLAATDTRARVGPTMARLFGCARIGLAINFLSSRAPRRNPGRLYLNPSEMLEQALGLTPAVRLDHGYLPHDFTLFLYRTPAWQAEE